MAELHPACLVTFSSLRKPMLRRIDKFGAEDATYFPNGQAYFAELQRAV